MANATSDAEDGKLWPLLVEKHFIDVIVEEEVRGNMPQGQFKKGLWGSIQSKFNLHINKNYQKNQLRQKYQRLKVQHWVFSELIGCTGMAWDPVAKTVVGSDEAWANAIVVSVIAIHNNYQSHLYCFLYK